MGRIDLRYADQTGFNLLPNVPYGCIRVGQQRGISSQKSGTLNIFGLLNLRGDLTSYQTAGYVNSQTVIGWLDDFAAGVKQPTVIVLDNAPWHRSKLVEDKMAQWQARGVYLFYLPTYCPHLNLIETLCRKMKHEWLRPKDFKNKEALHMRINHILEKYGGSEFSINFSIK
jgi:transposase